jgi:hypothetical protein
MRAIIAVAIAALTAISISVVAVTPGRAAGSVVGNYEVASDLHGVRYYRRHPRHRYDWSWDRQRAYEGYVSPGGGGGGNYSYPSSGGDGFIPGYANGS